MNEAELKRLRRVFADEADKFHDTSLAALYFSRDGQFDNRRFRQPNHAVVLWQAYGTLGGQESIERLVDDIQASDIDRAGIRGSQHSCYALVEGRATDLFIRMAARAGRMFSNDELTTIQTYARADFESNRGVGKSVFVTNSYPGAVWLNFVFFRLGLTHPLKFETQVDVDPFAASLAALDHLAEFQTVEQQHRASNLEELKFRVALSFPGESREIVAGVAEHLVAQLGDEAVFYDDYFKAQLARPNLDLLLQKIYHKNSALVVVFISSDYEQKSWCALEWRAIRDLIKQREDSRLMIVRLDEADISGLFSTDGYLDARGLQVEEIARQILTRLHSI